MSFLVSAIIVFTGVFLFYGVRIIAQTDVAIVERLGRFHRVMEGGFHIIIPVIDRVSAKVTIREQLIDIGRQQVITKDNVNINIDGIVFLKIFDAKAAVYSVSDYKQAIANLATTTLRGEIGRINLDDSLSSRDRLNAALQVALGDAANNWGVKIMRVEISEISVPRDIEHAMNLQMKAEREKRAIELKAQAEKEALIRNAEAQKQEKVLQAEAIERMADARKYEQIALAQGQSDAMALIAEQMSKDAGAAEFLLAKERIIAFNEMSKNPSKDKVIIPYNTSEFIGSLSVIADFLGKKQG
ncbi:paraslipin [Helicobacter sp. CLO-3]|uniref:SPFH domain-containing protein n=1 Tax=unclassified Helicobacter TaxID=2593540 RepID=UPI000805C6C1|nr:MULTISPECIES: stomatin-like protein [unclassified Helicobacter]OBV29591.1 paraslipin [Helicobacter sp. CLO-3]OHU84100.1 paraslipin [Helicobacter sp. CLO-3]